MSEPRRRSAPTAGSTHYDTDPLSCSRVNLNLTRPASPPRRKGSKASLPALEITRKDAAAAAAQYGSEASPQTRKDSFSATAAAPYGSSRSSAENRHEFGFRKQEPAAFPSARQDICQTHESHQTHGSDVYPDSLLSSGDSAISEALERTASAVASKVCPELSAVIQASLADQARELVKLLQPLCSELGVVAHRLTVAVERTESLKSDPGSSSDSSDSDLERHGVRSPTTADSRQLGSPQTLSRQMSPRTLSRQMSPDGDYSTSSTTNGEVGKPAREPRVASAPELPLPTKKSSTKISIERPPQSVTLSVLPDVRFGSNEGLKKAKDASRSRSKHKGEKVDSPCSSIRSSTIHSQSRINSKDVQVGSVSGSSSTPKAKSHGNAGKPQREKHAASLIGVSRGKSRPSSWQHLSHTTELRFLQDSLASELFKATYLVPGSTPSTSIGSKMKPWMSALPTHPLNPKGMQGLSKDGMPPVSPKVSPSAGNNMFASNGSSHTSYNSRQSGSKEFNSNEMTSPSEAHENPLCASPSSSSDEGEGKQPDEPLRCDRPSFSAPAHSTLLTLPPLTGECDDQSEKLASEEGRQHSFGSEAEESHGVNRHPRRRSFSQPPSRPGKDNTFGPVASLATQSADVMSCPKTAKEVRQLNEQELTKTIRQSMTCDSGSISSNDENGPEKQNIFDAPGSPAVFQKSPMGSNIAAVLLRVCGVLPWSQRLVWCSFVYFWILVLLMLLAIASCFQQMFDINCSHSRTSLGRGSDTAFALGALFVLLSCRTFQRELSDCNALLLSYAEKRGFLRHWAEISQRDAMVSLMVWICIVLERMRSGVIMPEFDCGDRKFSKSLAVLGMVGFMLASGLLMMLVHHILYIARCLSSMIDTFCCRFVELPDFTEAVTEWNVLQAVIRKSCETIQYCFFALQTTTTVAALLNVVDITRQVKEGYELQYILNLMPGALIVLVVIRMFFCAGAVTDKCARVPSLVNSLSFGSADLDRDRLYVVEYIAHSQAGFYIFEVRLTSATVLKTFYFSCVVALALATRVASEC